MTFSELDRNNGVPVNNRIDVAVGQPAQVTAQPAAGAGLTPAALARGSGRARALRIVPRNLDCRA